MWHRVPQLRLRAVSQRDQQHHQVRTLPKVSTHSCTLMQTRICTAVLSKPQTSHIKLSFQNPFSTALLRSALHTESCVCLYDSVREREISRKERNWIRVREVRERPRIVWRARERLEKWEKVLREVKWKSREMGESRWQTQRWKKQSEVKGGGGGEDRCVCLTEREEAAVLWSLYYFSRFVIIGWAWTPPWG